MTQGWCGESEVGTVPVLDWNQCSVARYAALKFFAGLLGDWFLEGIGAAMNQHRANDAEGDGEGFQVAIIMGVILQCKRRNGDEKSGIFSSEGAFTKRVSHRLTRMEHRLC